MSDVGGAIEPVRVVQGEVEPEKSLGLRLQQARQQAGLTQQELCQQAGLSYSTLAKIERGAIKAPSIFTIRSIAEALHISLDELVGLESAPVGVAAPPAKKRSRRGVRFIYFDINGCLVRFFQRAFTMIAEESGVPADIIETTFWHYNDAVCRGEMSLEEFNTVLGARLGMVEFNWSQYYLQSIDPIKEMHELVIWAADNYHVGLLSNIMPGLIPEMRQRGLLPDVPYDAIIDSSVVRVIKPEQEIYEIAQKEAGCLPQEILLIDDARPNLMAAERMGWHVLWFDDYRPSESVARIREILEPAE